MLRLSVLDQSTIVTDRPADASIRESLALARFCEAAGYHRYWVAEHHNSAAIAGSAPGDPHRRDRRDDVAHPRRQRGRDAAALFRAESGRAVPRARGDRAGPHRSRPRPRAGIGRAHRACAQPECGECRGPFPRPAPRSHRLDRQPPASRKPPVPRHPRRARRRERAGNLDARQLRLRRAGRRLVRPSVLLRAFHHRRARRRGGAVPLPRQLSPQRAPSLPARARSPSGRSRRKPRRRRSVSTPRARHGGSPAIAAPMRRCPLRRRRWPSRRARRSAPGWSGNAHARSSARPTRSRRSCARSPRRTRWRRSRF